MARGRTLGRARPIRVWLLVGSLGAAGLAAPASALPVSLASAPTAAAPVSAPAPVRARATTIPATTVPSTRAPATTVPVAGGAGAAAPPVPVVPGDISDGQDPTVLLQRAVALSTVAPSLAPLQASLARAQQVLDAQSVTAAQAGTAASAATAHAARADADANAATTAASDLQGALRQAALRIYTNGASTLIPTDPGTSADAINNAAAYEDTVLSPDGILAQRKAAAQRAHTAATERNRQQAAAVRDQHAAGVALVAAAGATTQIRQQLSALDTTTATLMATERAKVATQAGRALTSGAALEFTPTVALPAPVATTSVALSWAFSELGKTYVWGGTGPDVFDCSGLTQYAWLQAGVAVPRVAADQDAWTVPVPLSQLLPGDLVFYGTTDIHHVGMYIGGGLMVNAPHTGDVVRVSPIWWSDLAGFGRVHSAGVPVPSRVLPGVAHPTPVAVIPSVGAVPSESAPPPGYVALPGATSPVAPSPATTLPASPASPNVVPAGAPTTTTAVPVTSTTTLPYGVTTTTTIAGVVPSTTTTTSTAGTTTTTLPTTTSTTTVGGPGGGGARRG